MKVLCAGGGSGGHVTPVLAVINELSKLDPTLEAHFVCDQAFEAQSRGLMEHATVPVAVSVIRAGKLRRYHGVPLWKQFLDIPTLLKNIRDVFYIFIGFLQSVRLIQKFEPDVVFAKGGYVCLPLGLAARLFRIPLVIHDSDTRPGLTNSVLARYATKIATGAPLENYSYPADRSVYTGVPIDPAFHPFSPEQQSRAKQDIGVTALDKPLIVVTGGGLGAESINQGMLAIATKLIDDGFAVYHVTGKKHLDAVKGSAPVHPDYHVVAFVYKDMATVLGAATIVVSRASATFLQELAALAKPTIIVPAAHLGDQMKNALAFREANAAYVLDDTSIRNGSDLYAAIKYYEANPDAVEEMTKRFHSFAKPDAAASVARLIFESNPHKETV